MITLYLNLYLEELKPFGRAAYHAGHEDDALSTGLAHWFESLLGVIPAPAMTETELRDAMMDGTPNPLILSQPIHFEKDAEALVFMMRWSDEFTISTKAPTPPEPAKKFVTSPVKCRIENGRVVWRIVK
ncbi:hypothetical protein ACLBV5_09835 [Brevundimonas sp. M1A4_2e]